MSKEAYIFEVSKSGFDVHVLENSKKLPVLVEFMAVWSEPCIAMENNLSDLAREFAGQFVFAKTDIEEQTELKEQYQIKNVPTLLVFRNGEVEFTQEGQMQEEELRVLLKGMGIFNESDELRLQAREKHVQGDTNEAIMLLTQAIKKDPGNTRVAMDMVQIFLDLGETDQARALYNKLPEKDQQGNTGRLLVGQLTFSDLAAKTEGLQSLLIKVEQEPDNHDIRFDLAVCLIAKHDYNSAIEHLFTLFETEPDYKEGAVKEMLITIANMLAQNEPEISRNIRTKLGNLMS